MKISIVIPVFNAETTIERCVESFIVQGYDDLELILVEDHSEDTSYEKCLKLEKKFSEVSLFLNEGKGVSAARNYGLSKVTGNVVGFCDSDDTVCDTLLYQIQNVFMNNLSVSMITFGYNLVEIQNQKLIKRSLHPKKRAIWKREKMIEHIFYDNTITGSVCNKFFRKELIADILFDTEITHSEDMHFLIQLLTQKEIDKCLVLDEALYNYYSNPDSATNTLKHLFNENGEIKYIKTLEKIEDEFLLSKKEKELLRRTKYCVASDMYVGFKLNKNQKNEVKKIMRQNIIYFFKYPYITPVLNVKRIVNQVLVVLGLWNR